MKKVRLNLGCGPFKEAGYINIDIREDLKPDMVCDLSQGIPFPDDSIDEVRCYDFLEHISLGKTMFMMEEIWRVLKNGGRLDAQVPSTDGRGAFQDPTHLCHSEDTEVLTTTGFRLFNTLKGDEQIPTLNLETNIVSPQPVEKIQSYDYEGEMIHFLGRHVDCLVTPNHGMIVGSSSFKRIPASECLKFKSPLRVPSFPTFEGAIPEYFEIPNSHLVVERRGRAAHFIGDTVRLPIEPFMEFMGWWLSEGSATIHEKGNIYRVSVHQSEQANPENYERIGKCLTDMGYKPYRNAFGWYFTDKNLTIYLSKLGKSPVRYIPREIMSLDPSLLQILLTSLLLGDGTKNGSTSYTYGTTSPQLASDVQEIGIKCGYRTSWSVEGRIGRQVLNNPDYRANYDMNLIYLSHSEHQYLPREKSIVSYKGKVYCVTVPEDHVILTRRNGRVIWNGNSFWNVNSFLYYVDGAFRNSCGTKALFKGSVEQGWSNELMLVAHVHVLFYAIKGEQVPPLNLPEHGSNNRYSPEHNRINGVIQITTSKTIIQGGVEPDKE